MFKKGDVVMPSTGVIDGFKVSGLGVVVGVWLGYYAVRWDEEHYFMWTAEDLQGGEYLTEAELQYWYDKDLDDLRYWNCKSHEILLASMENV